MSKRLMPTYLIKFLENLYNGNRPLDFTRVMVTRQFIAKLKELYEDLGGSQPANYTQVLVPKYLQDFFNELEILEFDDDDISQEKTVPGNLVYPACRIDSIGGMSYKSNNLANNPTITSNATNDFQIFILLDNLNLPAGTYTLSFKNVNTLNSGTRYYMEAVPNINYAYTGAVSTKTDYSITFTTTAVITTRLTVRLQYTSGGDTGTTTNVMLNSGSTALPYEPYFENIRDNAVTSVKSYGTDNELLDTYTVPSAITSLEGYGQGINSTVYNNVDFASGKYVKKVGVVDLGSLTYNHFEVAGLGHLFRASVPTMAYNNTTNLLCAKYDTVLSTARVNGTIYKTQAGSAQIDIIDNSYNDAEAFKTAMDGILLYFDLATPTETTITENAPLLEVEEGGRVVLENEYNQDVPSEVVTWIKEN